MRKVKEMRTFFRIISIATLVLLFAISSVFGYESGSYGFFKDGNSIEYIQYPGALGTSVTGVSDDGKIVGTYWDANGTHGFLKIGNVYTSLDYPGATSTMPYDINNAGQIIGMYTDHGISGVAGSGWHSFLMEGNTYAQCNYPGSYSTSGTYAYSINNSGEIVGGYFTQFVSVSLGTTVDFHGFMTDGNISESFDIPAAYNTLATGISDDGKIVGYYANLSIDVYAHGFLKNGEVYTYFDIPGSANTYPVAINDAGQILFSSGLLEGNTYTPFSSFPTQIIDYGTGNYDILTYGSPVASDINDAGQIVGSIYCTVQHVPEPTTMLLLGLGLMGLVGLRRKMQ